jgi:hypothetical protein
MSSCGVFKIIVEMPQEFRLSRDVLYSRAYVLGRPLSSDFHTSS